MRHNEQIMKASSKDTTLKVAIVRSIIFPMLLLMVIASVVTVTFLDRDAVSQLESRTQSVADSVSVQVSELLWQYDTEGIQALLDNLILTGVMTSSVVTDQMGVEVSAGTASPEVGQIAVTRPLLHLRDGVPTTIGSLLLVTSTAQAKSAGLADALTLIAISFASVFLTMFAILILLNRRVVMPVLAIEKGLMRVTGTLHSFEVNELAPSHGGMVLELGTMGNAIRSMQSSLLKSQIDVQEKRAKLHHAAEIAKLGYGTVSVAQKRFTECDANLAQMLGLDPDDALDADISGESGDFQLLNHSVENQNAFRHAFAMGNTVTETIRLKLKNGEVRDHRVILEPHGTFGAPDFQLKVVMLDITDLRQSEERAHQAEKLQTIGKMTGGVAHDFNNILAIISGNLELIEGLSTNDEFKAMTQTASDAVNRGARVTHQLLAFARKQPLSPVSLDASHLMRDLRPIIKVSVGPNIEIEMIKDSGQWLTEVDPTQLESCILNLVMNAKDAMPDGGKLTLEVSNTRIDRDYARLHNEVEAGQYVCISVTDTGTGMPANVVEKAFEPFFTTKEVGKGTGLGLSMVFGFAKQSRGHVKVYSEVGVGTTVKMYLPRVYGQQPADLSPTKFRKLTDELAGRRILLIEDEAPLLALYSSQLRSLGCIVEAAVSGHEALARVGKIPVPDLILTDIILPGNMSGKQAADALGVHYPNTPVVYMSGYTENAIIHDGKLDPGNIMLQKPFTLTNLAATLHEVLTAVPRK